MYICVMMCRRTIMDDPFIRQYVEDLLRKIRTQVGTTCLAICLQFEFGCVCICSGIQCRFDPCGWV